MGEEAEVLEEEATGRVTIIVGKPILYMRERLSGYNFVDPLILKILRDSKISMSTLGINFRINEAVGRTVNLKVIRDHLIFLVKDKKISESLDEDNGVTYFKLLA